MLFVLDKITITKVRLCLLVCVDVCVTEKRREKREEGDLQGHGKDSISTDFLYLTPNLRHL